MSKKVDFKKIFTSKKTITAVALVILSAGLGIGTSLSINKTLKESLTNFATKESTRREIITENAANDVTGVTVKRPEITTEEEISVVKKDDFNYPVGKKIIKDYSNLIAVKSNTMNDWRVHNGVDFEAKEGDEVKAIQSGAVLAIFNDPLWGTIVEIDHGAGVVARYCGLGEKLKVSASDVVKGGDTIGFVSQIPIEAADGIHLHLEIKKDGAVTDPLEFLNKSK